MKNWDIFVKIDEVYGTVCFEVILILLTWIIPVLLLRRTAKHKKQLIILFSGIWLCITLCFMNTYIKHAQFIINQAKMEMEAKRLRELSKKEDDGKSLTDADLNARIRDNVTRMRRGEPRIPVRIPKTYKPRPSTGNESKDLLRDMHTVVKPDKTRAIQLGPRLEEAYRSNRLGFENTEVYEQNGKLYIRASSPGSGKDLILIDKKTGTARNLKQDTFFQVEPQDNTTFRPEVNPTPKSDSSAQGLDSTQQISPEELQNGSATPPLEKAPAPESAPLLK